MKNEKYKEEKVMYWSDEIGSPKHDRITGLTIPDCFTSIGEWAFLDFKALTSITIPDSVTSIKNFAFMGCSSLTSITIPDSVTSIGIGAFLNCNSLASITIGDSVTRIPNLAFKFCDSLTSITIGNGVTSIGGSAFFGCMSLTNIEVNAGNLNYMDIDGVLFNKEKTELIRYPLANGPSYVIPDSVTSIGDHAFSGCSSLTSIKIPNSVNYIAELACDKHYNNRSDLISKICRIAFGPREITTEKVRSELREFKKRLLEREANKLT
ncbi:leucine-rich repeat domain-containing protein [bacterium]|nr:leucine-rich repeat domain-containing protein [bacterium]